MTEQLSGIIKAVLKKTGEDVSGFDEAFLEKLIERRMEISQSDSVKIYGTLLENSDCECNELIHSLYVPYSEFFRNPLTYAILEKVLIPTVMLRKEVHSKKEVRIWSAACAGGQEAYSLAMLLNEFNEGRTDKINFRIFATDISETHITQAESGTYRQSELKMLTLKRIEEWFVKHGDTYAVKPELKKDIVFSVFDLLSEEYNCPPISIFGDFDVIFCANILFYYKQESRQKILKKLNQSLDMNGVLITGETEREILTKNNYVEMFPYSSVFSRMQ